jgi:hypothetical protein
MKDFAKALNSNSIIEMQGIPKSDLHSHARRSGHISHIEAWKGVQILIFNQTVSQEYLNLYNANLFNENELNSIRETGLKALNRAGV